MVETTTLVGLAAAVALFVIWYLINQAQKKKAKRLEDLPFEDLVSKSDSKIANLTLEKLDGPKISLFNTVVDHYKDSARYKKLSKKLYEEFEKEYRRLRKTAYPDMHAKYMKLRRLIEARANI